MLNLALGAIIGLTWGFIAGVVVKTRLRPRGAPKDVLDSMLEDFVGKEKGDIIKINKVEQFLKENKGDVALGDIINDDE